MFFIYSTFKGNTYLEGRNEKGERKKYTERPKTPQRPARTTMTKAKKSQTLHEARGVGARQHSTVGDITALECPHESNRKLLRDLKKKAHSYFHTGTGLRSRNGK